MDYSKKERRRRRERARERERKGSVRIRIRSRNTREVKVKEDGGIYSDGKSGERRSTQRKRERKRARERVTLVGTTRTLNFKRVALSRRSLYPLNRLSLFLSSTLPISGSPHLSSMYSSLILCFYLADFLLLPLSWAFCVH